MKVFFLLILCFMVTYLVDYSTKDETIKDQTSKSKVELQNKYCIKEEGLKLGAEEESQDKKIA